jgi:hypothetical protein
VQQNGELVDLIRDDTVAASAAARSDRRQLKSSARNNFIEGQPSNEPTSHHAPQTLPPHNAHRDEPLTTNCTDFLTFVPLIAPLLVLCAFAVGQS